MKISVLIPAYNCAKTLRSTLESVFAQTSPADEIIVLDDGSTDQTPELLRSYQLQIKFFRKPNGGVAETRNALVAAAKNEMIAFIDADDLWHPRYLETQRKLFNLHPNASAYFIAHTSFTGLGEYKWQDEYVKQELRAEYFEAAPFLKRFRTAPGHFVLSFACISATVLRAMGDEPFRERIAEDVYLCWMLPLYGPIVFASAPLLGAYRGTPGSLSSNRLKSAELEIKVLELLEGRFATADIGLEKEFEVAFHSKLRTHAKILMSAGRAEEAHAQLRRSLGRSINPVSLAKSFALLSLSYLPRPLQPKWPPVDRV
ncbi:glycosyl transferase family 2 [Edaphobacter aggregans]|uniref:Glycosyl transferase family 2 n=1 Tax=Edaphobacter aggregans TaxID=570835 RepID=A0A3R9R3Z1_9BACT|nr:glycosyltransferase family A protein [Edaphobacter aggregans]RSL17386.1 glycosyl transferase family 2 [Edaphobacter aggregans]